MTDITAAEVILFAWSTHPVVFVSMMVFYLIMTVMLLVLVVDMCWIWWAERRDWLKQYRGRKAAEEKVARLEKQIEELTMGPYRRE